MRWKLLIRYLFSELRLLKKEVKLSLLNKRFKVSSQDVMFGHIKESVDESREHFEGVDVALEEIIALENLNDLLFEFLHERLIDFAQNVNPLSQFLIRDVLNTNSVFQSEENALENSSLVSLLSMS